MTVSTTTQVEQVEVVEGSELVPFGGLLAQYEAKIKDRGERHLTLAKGWGKDDVLGLVSIFEATENASTWYIADLLAQATERHDEATIKAWFSQTGQTNQRRGQLVKVANGYPEPKNRKFDLPFTTYQRALDCENVRSREKLLGIAVERELSASAVQSLAKMDTDDRNAVIERFKREKTVGTAAKLAITEKEADIAKRDRAEETGAGGDPEGQTADDEVNALVEDRAGNGQNAFTDAINDAHRRVAVLRGTAARDHLTDTTLSVDDLNDLAKEAEIVAHQYGVWAEKVAALAAEKQAEIDNASDASDASETEEDDS